MMASRLRAAAARSGAGSTGSGAVAARGARRPPRSPTRVVARLRCARQQYGGPQRVDDVARDAAEQRFADSPAPMGAHHHEVVALGGLGDARGSRAVLEPRGDADVGGTLAFAASSISVQRLS